MFPPDGRYAGVCGWLATIIGEQVQRVKPRTALFRLSRTPNV
jgi:hypothetical protein